MKLYFNGILYVLIALLPAYHGVSQEADSSGIYIEYLVAEQMEESARALEINSDQYEIIRTYEYYFRHKINLNGNDIRKLSELHLLSEFQVNKIREYRRKYGNLLTLYELLYIEGLDETDIRKIFDVVDVKPGEERKKFSIRDLARKSRQQLLLRYTRILQAQKGYLSQSGLENTADTALVYPGTPDRMLIRYEFTYFGHMSFGFVLEKDPGEPFLPAKSHKQAIPIPSIFDHTAVYLHLKDISIIKSLIIGDFEIRSGQGLNLWNSYGFGNTAEAVDIKRFPTGIRAHTSTDENNFFRGGAICLGLSGIEFTGFISINNVDASIVEFDSLNNKVISVSSFRTSGLHRRNSEIHGRKILQRKVTGGIISFKNRIFKIGLTAHYEKFGAEVKQPQKPYTAFRFQGNSNTITGVDFSFIRGKVSLFGEFSLNNFSSYAMILGGVVQPLPYFTVAFNYRNYRKDYINFYSNVFGSSGKSQNEEGIYLGINLKLNKSWGLSAFADIYRNHWLTFVTDAPARHADYSIQFKYVPDQRTIILFRYRHRKSMVSNNIQFNYTSETRIITNHNIRIQFYTHLMRDWSFRNRIEWKLVQGQKDNKLKGIGMFSDISYKPEKLPFTITFRASFFNTDSFDSRIYAYENDVLYAYSVPAYFYKGNRFYLVIRVKASRFLDIWVRYGSWIYHNKNTIGNGLDEIDGNVKSEIKIQARVKL